MASPVSGAPVGERSYWLFLAGWLVALSLGLRVVLRHLQAYFSMKPNVTLRPPEPHLVPPGFMFSHTYIDDDDDGKDNTAKEKRPPRASLADLVWGTSTAERWTESERHERLPSREGATLEGPGNVFHDVWSVVRRSLGSLSAAWVRRSRGGTSPLPDTHRRESLPPAERSSRPPRLHGWRFEVAPRTAQSLAGAPTTPPNHHPVVLFFHGNAGNLQNYTEALNVWTQISPCVLAFDYRGFGFSDGVATTKALTADARRCVRVARAYAAARTGDPTNLVVVGYSMGTGAASYVGQLLDGQLRAVVLEAPYRSLKSAALHAMPGLAVIHPLLDALVDNEHHVRALRRTPLAVVHGRDDEVCPFNDGLALFYAAATPQKVFFESAIPRHHGSHTDTRIFRWLLERTAAPK